MAGEHTWGADRSAWVTSGSLPSVQNYRPYIVFSSPMQKYGHPLHFTYFSVYGWLSELIYFCFFFPVICWSYPQTEISVTLSIGNKLYSRHHILYFSFLWKPLCSCYLATALNLLSSSSPAKLVYYTFTFGLLPLRKIWTPLSTRLWVKYYHCCFSAWIALALNNL